MGRQPSTADVYRLLGLAFVACLVILTMGTKARPSRVGNLLETAAKRAAAGEPAQALDSLELALEFEPALGSLDTAAALLAIQAGDAEAAQALLVRAHARGADPAQLSCLESKLALALSAEGEAPPEPDPACLTGSASLGTTLEATLKQGRLDLAALALESRVESRPQDLKAWEALAVVTALRDPSRVESVVQRAFRTFPQGSDVLDGMFRLYRRAPGDLSPAERAAQAGELLAAQGDWHLAAAAWATALELEPDFPEARAFLGLARSKTGGDGLADLQRAAAEAPGDPVVRMLLGQYWVGQGDASSALRELAYARSLAPSNPAFTATYASALAQAGRTAEAAGAYRDAAEMDPQDATFWNLLAEFSLEHEFEIETLGRAAARNAAALSPGDASALATLGYLAHLSESSRLGEQLLVRAIGLAPENPTAWYRYGLLLLDQGRFRESRSALAAAAALDAQGPIGRLALRSIASVPVEQR